MIGFLSGQDGLILATRAGTTRGVSQQKFPRNPYNKSGQDAGLFSPPKYVLFCEFKDLDSVSVHKHLKRELGQYPALLYGYNSTRALIGC